MASNGFLQQKVLIEGEDTLLQNWLNNCITENWTFETKLTTSKLW